MKILIFTEGTAIMHSSAVDKSRAERVLQSSENAPELDNFRAYVPNGDVVGKLKRWQKQGAEIHYLTSRMLPNEIADVQAVLHRFGFPDATNLHFKQAHESYADVAEKVLPDVLIEDDCESIGGEAQMTYPHLSAEAKERILSIVTQEFAGIDDLPDDVHKLTSVEGSRSTIETEYRLS